MVMPKFIQPQAMQPKTKAVVVFNASKGMSGERATFNSM